MNTTDPDTTGSERLYDYEQKRAARGGTRIRETQHSGTTGRTGDESN